jgi:hypothetical protein
LKSNVIFNLPNFAWFLQPVSGEQSVFLPLNLIKGNSKKGASRPLVFVMLAATQFFVKEGQFETLAQPWPRPGMRECVFGDRFSESLSQQYDVPIMSRQGRPWPDL